MTLYKYTSLDSGKAILGSGKIGFRSPVDLNDPFELYSGHPMHSPESANPLHGVVDDAVSLILRGFTAILSLSKTAADPLMWAHYGVSHSGITLGLDESCDLLSSEEDNLIPARYGQVAYASCHPSIDLVDAEDLLAMRDIYAFDPDLLEALSKRFLTKPQCWSYEQEVRVVKVTHFAPQAGGVETIEIGGAPLHLFDLPYDSVTEVITGARNPLTADQRRELAARVRSHHPRLQLLRCFVDGPSWGLRLEEDQLDR